MTRGDTHGGCQGAGRLPASLWAGHPITFTLASGTQGSPGPAGHMPGSRPRVPVTPGCHWLFPSFPSQMFKAVANDRLAQHHQFYAPCHTPSYKLSHRVSCHPCHTVLILQRKCRGWRSLDSDPLWSLLTMSLGAWGSSPINLRSGQQAPTSGRLWGAQRGPCCLRLRLLPWPP